MTAAPLLLPKLTPGGLCSHCAGDAVRSADHARCPRCGPLDQGVVRATVRLTRPDDDRRYEVTYEVRLDVAASGAWADVHPGRPGPDAPRVVAVVADDGVYGRYEVVTRIDWDVALLTRAQRDRIRDSFFGAVDRRSA